MNKKVIIGIAGLLGLAFLFVGLPFIAAPKADSSFSAYTSAWDGTAIARGLLEDDQYTVLNVQASPLILPDTDPKGTLLCIVGMEKKYTPPERRALDDFMRDGGTILLLDDRGYGSEFTGAHGIGYRSRQIYDVNYVRNQSFVQVAATINGQTYKVLLNEAVALADTEEKDANSTSKAKVEKILVSSNESYLDVNDNHIIDVVDKTGPFNVGLTVPVGVEGGRLIVISDSGWVINDMIERGGESSQNGEFLKALIGQYLDKEGLRKRGEEKLVLFDESRREPTMFEYPIVTTERTMLVLLRSLPFTGILLSLGMVMLAVVNLVRLPGPESWFHRFLPNTYVPPPQPKTEREVLVDLLEIKRVVDEGAGGVVNDPMIAQALNNPQAVAEQDVPTLLRRLATTMELEVPLTEKEKEETEQRRGATPASAASGPTVRSNTSPA